jgi:hypothetical protein
MFSAFRQSILLMNTLQAYDVRIVFRLGRRDYAMSAGSPKIKRDLAALRSLDRLSKVWNVWGYLVDGPP